jgi:membrane protease YdiL (CAAX protease family)
LDISQRNLFLLGIFTLFGFGGIGLAILYFAEGVHPLIFFKAGKVTWWWQVIYGTLFGIPSAIAALGLVNTKFFSNEMQFFSDLINKLAPTYGHAVFYSVCAGVGEEILFRGGIQPYLGIWVTSFVFILLHGYINPFNIALTIYGLFMVFISAGLGYLFEMYGIIASIVAHFLFDLVMFVFMRKSLDNKSNE